MNNNLEHLLFLHCYLEVEQLVEYFLNQQLQLNYHKIHHHLILLILLLVIGLAFAESAVIFEDLRPTEALKRSWSLASGRRWRFLLFFIVNGLFAFSGVLLCCVGVFATSAITRLATAEAFLQLTAAPRASSEGSQGAQLD